MIEVKVRKGQSIEKAISIFKRKVKDSKILYELREREYYMKRFKDRVSKYVRVRIGGIRQVVQRNF